MLLAACSPLELLMICALCRDKVDDDVIRNVERIIELVMISDNMLQLSSNVFSLMDIRDVISFFMYRLIAYLYVFE